MLIDQMQDYYHKRASEYDSSMSYDDPEQIKKLLPVITQIKHLVHGQNVLELACGPGFWTGHIIETAKFVIATDYNQSTLDQALKKNLSTAKVSFKQADAYQLESIKGEFDLLIAVDWLAHVPLSKMNDFLLGVSKRLGRSKKVIFVDQLPRAHSLTGIFDNEGNHLQQRTLKNGKTFSVVKHYFSNQECEDLFDPHFTDLSIQRFDECSRVMVSAQIR